MPPVKSQPASGENQPAAETPVFVDASGRRRRWVRGGVGAAIVVLLGYLGLVTMAMAGRPNLVTMFLPGSATTRHEATPRRALPTPVLHQQRVRIDGAAGGSGQPVDDAHLSTGDPANPSSTPTATLTATATASQGPGSRHTKGPESSQDPIPVPPPLPSQWPTQNPSEFPTYWPSNLPSQFSSLATTTNPGRHHKPKHKHKPRHHPHSAEPSPSIDPTEFYGRSPSPSATPW